MNSMHGFWVALAEHAGGSWWRPQWWPYWDNGIPFEFTYAPLVPALTAVISATRGVPALLGFQTVTALAYCLVPLTLFFAAWRLTGLAGYSFAAGLLYSLTSPTELLVPDGTFHWGGFWEARRLFNITYWDETPHLLALVFLPLTILFLARAFETRNRRYYAAAGLSIVAASYASAFAPIATLMAALGLLFTLRLKSYARNITIVFGVGAIAYAAVAAFLPPSLIRTMEKSSANPWRGEPGWNAGSITALAIVILGWTLLIRYLPRWTADWRLQFFALFTYLASSIPMIAADLHRRLLTQPVRYKLEMEIGLALLVVFASRSWFEKIPRASRRAVVFLLLALAIEQVYQFRDDAKKFLQPGDVNHSIEARASRWAAANLAGVRLIFPGSIAQWANAFSDVTQFSGGSWSMAYNRVQQIGLETYYGSGDTAERDRRVSLAWLEAFGVGAAAVSAPDSEEYWRGFLHPAKFEGVLPVLWREGGVTIYRIPQRSPSLAHVVPEEALVRRRPIDGSDIADLERYDAALEDPSLSQADMRWDGRNRIRIHTAASGQDVLSIQVSYHPGWHAVVNGRRAGIHSDALGLMWLRPNCAADCEVQLDYSGGFELWFFRLVSLAALLALILLLGWPERRRPTA